MDGQQIVHKQSTHGQPREGATGVISVKPIDIHTKHTNRSRRDDTDRVLGGCNEICPLCYQRSVTRNRKFDFFIAPRDRGE